MAPVARNRVGDSHRVGSRSAGASQVQPHRTRRRIRRGVDTLVPVNRQSATYSTANGSAVNDPPWIVRTRRVGIPIFGTWGRRRPGVLWALVPLVTLGIGS